MKRLGLVLAALVTAGLVAVLVTAVGASANTGSATVDCSGAVFSYSQFANEPLPIVVHEQVLIDGQIVAAKDVTVTTDTATDSVPVTVPGGSHTILARAFWERDDGRLGQIPDASATVSGCAPCPAPPVTTSGQFGNAPPPGSLSGKVGRDFEVGTVFALGSSVAPVDINFYASGGLSDQSFVPVVYNADALGNPTTLLVSGAPVTVPAGAAPQWFSTPLPAVTLPPGNYLLGLMSGPTAGQAQIYFSAGVGHSFQAKAPPGQYPPGYPIPLNVWDTDTTTAESLSIYLNIGAPTTGGCGKIIIEKQTDPDGSAATFQFTGDVSGTLGDGQQAFTDNLPAGTYTSTETVPSGWDLTAITCNDANSTGDTGTKTATFRLEAGETVKCTFYDKQKRGKIIIEKQTDPDGAYGSFTFTGDVSGTLSDGQQAFKDNLLPGTYTSTEIVPSGWSLQSIVCNDGASATPSSGNVSTKTATFKLDPGETVKCVFTDKKVPPPPCAIGDYVWKDLNKNGKQDDGTTSGINGVKLYLFDFSSWSIVASTTTANHPSTGKPGYYKFTVTCGKKYKIIVGIENFLKYKPLYGLFPTQPFQGGDPTKDSDGILIFTFPIVVNSGENLTIDFGYRVKEYWMYDYDHCYGW